MEDKSTALDLSNILDDLEMNQIRPCAPLARPAPRFIQDHW
jgi:hypothetical protein